jgi:2-hydroxychromene-2-carboxylate isomerase
LFDVISPFAYLSLKQLPRLPSHVQLELVPVLFAGLLEHFGQIGPAEIASKRRFTYRFALWRARKMGVAMRMPASHPFNPLGAQRLIIAAGTTRQAVEMVFDVVFDQGLDVSDPAVLAAMARRLGIQNVQSALSDPAVKTQLRTNTDWAISKGVFGVPTFVVDDELFWGHDSFDMLLDYIDDPAAFNDASMRTIEDLPVGVVRPGSVRTK